MRVTIVDYGVGNLLSVVRAFQHFDAEPVLATSPDIVQSADRLVLPGVGAFGNCMDRLRDSGLFESTLEFLTTGQPFLGICVGMQMLFESSAEFGNHRGFGMLPGKVMPIPKEAPDGTSIKRPVIGWHALESGSADWNDSPLRDLQPGAEMYFVHSFAARPENPDDVLATYDHHGVRITAAVRRGSVYGTQFHPEKSGTDGLSFIHGFLSS